MSAIFKVVEWDLFLCSMKSPEGGERVQEIPPQNMPLWTSNSGHLEHRKCRGNFSGLPLSAERGILQRNSAAMNPVPEISSTREDESQLQKKRTEVNSSPRETCCQLFFQEPIHLSQNSLTHSQVFYTALFTPMKRICTLLDLTEYSVTFPACFTSVRGINLYTFSLFNLSTVSLFHRLNYGTLKR